ncbi:MAG: hypothetical protein AB8B50_11755 [Pirellulaceae bacterium]
MDPLLALQLLAECTGDDIWSLEYCRARKVPELWIDELSDCYESSFEDDRQTIYVERQRTNQYEGIRDVDLALKLGEFLGVETSELSELSLSRVDLVRSIQEAAEEG